MEWSEESCLGDVEKKSLTQGFTAKAQEKQQQEGRARDGGVIMAAWRSD
jgi:hypothetical protein